MKDTCEIKRKTGSSTDPDTGVVTSTYAVVYPQVGQPGKCRVQQRALESQGSDVGEARIYQVPWELQLPMATSTGIEVEDVATITACVLDPDLVGRAWWVKGKAGGTHKTARRLQVEEVTG
jgi:hypothetical protein